MKKIVFLLAVPFFTLCVFVFQAWAPCDLSVGNFVWNDLNRNGLQDDGEPGIPGVIVTLRGPSGDPTGVDITDSYGYYEFPNRCNITFSVEVAIPSGYAATAPCSTDQTTPNDSNCSPTIVNLTSNNDTIDFGFVVPATGCVRSPGYWKNHPDAWPVEKIVIGGTSYEKEYAITLMGMPVRGDKRYTMFKALVAARLNVLSLADFSCISSVIDEADAWMAANPFGSALVGSSAAWSIGEPLYLMLDAYNNGELCVPYCD